MHVQTVCSERQPEDGSLIPLVEHHYLLFPPLSPCSLSPHLASVMLSFNQETGIIPQLMHTCCIVFLAYMRDVLGGVCVSNLSRWVEKKPKQDIYNL